MARGYLDLDLPEEVSAVIKTLDERERSSELPYQGEQALTTGEHIIQALVQPDSVKGGAPMSTINILPPVGPPAPCLPVLLVAIGSHDSVKDMIFEAIKHISDCQRQGRPNKYVLFYAANWNHGAWLKQMQWFRDNARGTWLKTPGGRWYVIR